MASLTLASVSYDRSPTFGTLTPAQESGSGGATQVILTSLWLGVAIGGVDYNRSPIYASPPANIPSSAGGSAQTPLTALWLNKVDYDRSPVNITLFVDFTHTQPIATNPYIVEFMAAVSNPGFTVSLWSWDFGDGYHGSGNPIRHEYLEFGTYAVTIYATIDPLDIVLTRTRTITIADPRAGPDETPDDVLNKEIGFHKYEPVWIQGQTSTGLPSGAVDTPYQSTQQLVADRFITAETPAKFFVGGGTITSLKVSADTECYVSLLRGQDVIRTVFLTQGDNTKDLLEGTTVTYDPQQGWIVRIYNVGQDAANLFIFANGRGVESS